MGKENSSPWNWNYYFWLLKSADRHWHSDCFSTSLNLLENFAETWGYSCQKWETIGGFCQIKWIWPAMAINLHPPTGTRPPLWGPLAELHIHTCLPTLHPHPNFFLTSLRITTSNRFSRDWQDVPARTRCPRKDKVSPEQLYFHIKRPFEKSIASPGLDTHTHTLVTSCDDSVSTLSLNLVP